MHVLPPWPMRNMHGMTNSWCSCPEFVQLIASEANTVSEEEKKKTLNPEHVVKALDRLGFAPFTGDVSQFLEEVKENDKKCELVSFLIPLFATQNAALDDCFVLKSSTSP